MKALTVQQPWAWAIVHGGKTVENRTQAWSYRGPLAIHAGARWSERGAVAGPVIAAAVKASPGDREMVERYGVDPQFEGYPRGVLIGMVDLVDVHVAQPARHAFDDVWAAECCSSPWGEFAEGPTRPVVHLMLENPRPLAEPVPCRGALGLWTVPAGVDDQVHAQLETGGAS